MKLIIAESGKGKWETREKELMYIRDMGDNHLLFSIRLIARMARVYLTELAWSAAEYAATTGGEMAANAAEQESMRAFEMAGDEEQLHDYCMEEFAKYRELDAERLRRKLDRMELV